MKIEIIVLNQKNLVKIKINENVQQKVIEYP